MKTEKLYGGEINISFNENNHRFSLDDGKYVDLSVTGATGVVDKSGALMGWVAKMMGLYLVDNWNVKKSYTESQKQELIDTAKREYRRLKTEAADYGTAIHEWVSEWILGNKPAMPENEKVVNGITAFLKFQKENKVKWLESEKIIYSKKYKYAGILDGVGMIGKDLTIVDFKSSNGIYDEMRFQVAGYRLAYEEETGKKMDKSIIIRFGKEDGEFEVVELDNYDRDKKAFLACVELKRRLGEIKSASKITWPNMSMKK